MKLTNQEKNLTAHILDMYVDALIKKIDGREPSPKVMRCVEELDTIKSVLLKFLDEEPETITGVLTIPSNEPRTIGDIYSELSNHPDFVAGSYYDKDSVIDIIISQIDYDYDDDDKLVKDAEEIYENNARQIFKNIDNAYDYGMEHVDFTEGCDLTLEKQTK
jgi:hypothetical protein